MPRSNKNKYTPIAGLHRVIEKEPTLCTRITGRHMGAVNYLVSLAAERAGHSAAVGTEYLPDGRLSRIIIHDAYNNVIIPAGHFLYLHPDSDEIEWLAPKEHHKELRSVPL